ncbi:MAG: hypothetical protein NC453_23470 [Muribaculum sp.]|nr:hypothetical protein [Muribaculum sp.]
MIKNPASDEYADVCRCIRNLMIAAHESRHLLLGDYDVVDWAIRIFERDPDVNALMSIRANYSTLSIPSELTEYVEVVSGVDCCRLEPSSKIRIHCMNYAHFKKTDSLNTATVLGEDLNDAKFYQIVDKWYREKLNSKTCTQFITDGGGGRNTGGKFQLYAENGSIVLCIVDTDRRYPNATVGKTCRGCRREISRMYRPIHMYYEPDVHEIENLIPKEIIDELAIDWNGGRLANKQTFDALYNELPDDKRENLRYFDMKSGFTKHPEFKNLPEYIAFAKMCCETNPMIQLRPDFDTYFSQAEDMTTLHPGVCGSLLKLFVGKYTTGLPKTDYDFENYQLAEWLAIGQHMLNIGICRPPEALN